MMLKTLYDLVFPIIAGLPLVQENAEIYHMGKFSYWPDHESASKQGI
jgi:hypothetical protein